MANLFGQDQQNLLVTTILQEKGYLGEFHGSPVVRPWVQFLAHRLHSIAFPRRLKGYFSIKNTRKDIISEFALY